MTATSNANGVQFTIITGISGAGMSEAAKVFEDLGYFVIDNLPPALIESMAGLASLPGSTITNVALVVDVRGRQFFAELQKSLDTLGERGIEYRIVFLEASNETLVKRYEFTRHRHPLAESDRVMDGIRQEREVVAAVREAADVIIDTSNFSVHDLRDKVKSLFADTSKGGGIAVNVISFGYKHGHPLDSDLVFDVRFLPNPHWVVELRPLTGLNRKVRGFVLTADGAEDYLKTLRELLELTLPGYVREGRHYLTIAVGCTGGKHRSVVVADELGRFLEDKGFNVAVYHRDIERE